MGNLCFRSIWLHRPGRGVGVVSPVQGILFCHFWLCYSLYSMHSIVARLPRHSIYLFRSSVYHSSTCLIISYGASLLQVLTAMGRSSDGCVFAFKLQIFRTVGREPCVFDTHWHADCACACFRHSWSAGHFFWGLHWDTHVCIAFLALAVVHHELDGVGMRWDLTSILLGWYHRNNTLDSLSKASSCDFADLFSLILILNNVWAVRAGIIRCNVSEDCAQDKTMSRTVIDQKSYVYTSTQDD